MKLIRKIWFILVSVVILTACSDDVPEKSIPSEVKGRTLLSYIVSNNGGLDLDKYLKANVVDMYKGLFANKEPSVLVVYFRPKNRTGETLTVPSILKFVTDGKGNINGRRSLAASELVVKSDYDNASELFAKIVEEAEVIPFGDENANATDPKVMTKALLKMKELAPSENYGLTMGSHATGWMFQKEVQKRSFGDDNGYHINISQLANVLETVFGQQKLDFILFDACMMAQAEVAYELRNSTHKIVASTFETPVDGHPYNIILHQLYAKDVNYQYLCDTFAETNKRKKLWGALSAINCDKIEELADWMKINLPLYDKQLTRSLARKTAAYGRGFFDGLSYDVVDVFRQLEIDNFPELKELVDNVVIAKSMLTRDEVGINYKTFTINPARYSGMGMYLPFISGNVQYDGVYWDEYYINSFGWSKAVGWEKFKN